MQLFPSTSLLRSRLGFFLGVTLLWLVADNALEFAFPTYLGQAGKSFAEIGLLLAIASLGSLLIDLPAGYLSDVSSRKKLMVYGLLLSALSSVVVFSFSGNFTLAGAFFLWGLGFQLWRVPRDAFFASLTRKGSRPTAYAFDNQVRNVGQTLGAAFGGIALLYFGFAGVVGGYVLLLLAACVLLWFFLSESGKLGRSDFPRGLSLLAELRSLSSFGRNGFLLLCLTALFTAWEQVLWTFEPLFYGPEVLGVPATLGGLLLAAFSLPGIFLSYPAGRLAERFGEKKLLLAGMLAMGVSISLFSFASDLVHVFVLALLVSVGWTASLPALNSLVVDAAQRNRRGAMSGLWSVFMDAGFVAGPIAAGLAADAWGLRSSFLLMGAVFIAGAVLLALAGEKNN